ncbi:MAG: bifunctional folylpolyglutamate synthase/dihydrofolate synthase [Ruminococcus sp.]|nr:bifunctional folylpolyglutamate synthase/dihydrofolate synthase [Ruminococcus sp.]
MNYFEAMDFIGEFTKSGAPIKDLSRAEELMRSVGDPQEKLRFVHIAGTNGKGTTVEFISEVLMEAGYTTGQFTSPYILRYNDRIRVNGTEISDEDLARICTEVAEKVGERRDYSQFEITMAIAMLYFLEKRCGIVVLEAGIGGLLDCTNVIPSPEVAVITSVALDHTDILGKTIKEIAVQKAGIIKPGCDVVTALSIPKEAYDVIKKVAGFYGADVYLSFFEQLAYYDDQGIAVQAGSKSYHLKMNSVAAWRDLSTALMVFEILKRRGFDISEDDISIGVGRARVIGRTEYFHGDPDVILDGSHNMEGVDALERTLNFYTDGHVPVITVAGMIRSKDYHSCIERIAGFSCAVLTVDDFAPNAVPAEELAQLAGDDAYPYDSLEEAFLKAQDMARSVNGMVVVCGSLYLVSEFASSDMYRGDRK